jgi:cardiolipin synthase
VLVGACAVPDIDRYLLQTEPTPVRLEGARGPLTRAESEKILANLKARSPDSALLERHMMIEEALAGNPLNVGNKVLLLQDGQATYPAMLAAIRGAKHHVHLETYIFDDDEVGRTFAAALMERAKAGAKVRLIYDAFGSNKTPREFFERLAAGGVEVRAFNPATPTGLLTLNHRDHRKLTLVDGRVAFLGGINISSVYGTARSGSSGSAARRSDEDDGKPFEERPWRDTQVRIEGPAVDDFQQAFLKQWARVTNQPPISDKAYFPQLKAVGNEIVRALEASAAEKAVNPVYLALVSAIDNADRQIHITNAYFVPHPDLVKALVGAARRGVDVHLILPGRTDSWLAFNAGRSFYEDLLEAGVKIHERKARLLHAKTATIDGVWSTVGSTNLDWRSLAHNDELNAVILGPEFAAQMEALFAKDVADSTEITREAWLNRPFASRIREHAARAWALML